MEQGRKGASDMADSVHSGHRSRMRRRFLETGFSGFQPHEVLEMMLYYGIPRRDTNELAHNLLERYGSLHDVLCADPAALMQEPGISENAAVLIALFRAVQQYDAASQMVGIVLDNYRKVCKFFVDIYMFEQREIVRAALLDENLRVIRCETVSEGHPSAAQMTVRQLTELAYRANSNTMILAHNHPRGTAMVSGEDIAATRHLVPILYQCGITLADHVVVSGDTAVSMREQGVFIGLEID